MASTVYETDNCVAAAVRTRPRAIPPAMITKRKSIDEFAFLSNISMGLRLVAQAPLKNIISLFYNKYSTIAFLFFEEYWLEKTYL